MEYEISDSGDIFYGSFTFWITNIEDIEFKVYINTGLGQRK
jgi:hypothetical protein